MVSVRAFGFPGRIGYSNVIKYGVVWKPVRMRPERAGYFRSLFLFIQKHAIQMTPVTKILSTTCCPIINMALS